MLCYTYAGKSPAFHHGIPDSMSGLSMCDLWLLRLRWGVFFSSGHFRFILNIVPPMPYICISLICQRRYMSVPLQKYRALTQEWPTHSRRSGYLPYSPWQVVYLKQKLFQKLFLTALGCAWPSQPFNYNMHCCHNIVSDFNVQLTSLDSHVHKYPLKMDASPPPRLPPQD